LIVAVELASIPTAGITVMRIVPVLDLLNGKVVRGVAGNRAQYAPIKSRLCTDPSPASVASGFASLGFKECYIADLSAIAGAEPDFASYYSVSAAGVQRLWIDAGIRSLAEATELQASLARRSCNWRIIVGSESFLAPSELPELVDRLGPERVAFSLDLKAGRPLVAAIEWRNAEPFEIASHVVRCRVRSLIVLDLANVGVSAGTSTEELCTEIRRADSNVELIAGGGVRNTDDLWRLRDWGCNAALVASAIHDGKITVDELRYEFL
jgi:phosphoribosylformimino-5-aminoimidazole carboxamide ribotide isomerase